MYLCSDSTFQHSYKIHDIPLRKFGNGITLFPGYLALLKYKENSTIA